MSRFHNLVKQQPQHVLDLDLPPNMACVLREKGIIDVKEIPLPVLQPDGVLVKIIATGICGSDAHNFVAGGVGGRPPARDLVMGHESAGEVIAVGELVTTHQIGDRVAVEPGLPCRRCSNCKTGRVNICLDMKYCGSPGSVGSLCRFHALPADMAPHIPDNVPWDEAGSIQPLAVGVQIANRLDLRAHQTIAIVGCGPIGLIAGAVAHAYSARRVIGFDHNPERVAFAKRYLSPLTGRPIFDSVFLTEALPETPPDTANGQVNGCGHTVPTNGTAAPDYNHGHVHLQLNGDSHAHGPRHVPEGDHKFEWAKRRVASWIKLAGLAADGGVDKVVEATGAEDGMVYGVALGKQGSAYLAVGLSHQQTHRFPTLAVTYKEMDVRGITRYTSVCFPSALDMLSRGVVDVKSMITASFPLSQSQQAFEAVAGGKELKVIIRNQEV